MRLVFLGGFSWARGVGLKYLWFLDLESKDYPTSLSRTLWRVMLACVSSDILCCLLCRLSLLPDCIFELAGCPYDLVNSSGMM